MLFSYIVKLLLSSGTLFLEGLNKNKPVIYYGDQILEVVFNYTYLGIAPNYNGSFNLANKRLYDIGCRAMFEILKKRQGYVFRYRYAT